ncbi:MAG: hypothetical protein R3D85_05025 [Paracoccaceae bacterium]|jgi:hypothetical protein
MFRRLIALGLGLGAVITAIPAHAEDCALRTQVVDRLTRDYAERLTAGGMHGESADGVIEVWASPETGTFTVIRSDASGLSCILATGTDWHGAAWFAETPGTVAHGTSS